jgi:tetratricopeptide (TPR) repeat protein
MRSITAATPIIKQANTIAPSRINQVIRLDPSDADAFSNRGAAYKGKGQYDRAVEDYNQAIRLNPNYATAFYNRGASWARKNDLQRALADFKKFSELAPSDPDGPEAVERVTKGVERPVTSCLFDAPSTIDSLQHRTTRCRSMALNGHDQPR